MSTLWQWPGSRWWRVDLHAHSPISYDFKPGAGEPDRDYGGWLTAISDAEIHAVAVTDHNTADAISELQDTISSDGSCLFLFPGVELTASDGTHLILIMDPDKSQQHIDALLSTLEVPVDQRGQKTGRSTFSVEQILGKCGDDVLVVGAHINGPDGLLDPRRGGLQRIQELRHPGLAAVEVDPMKDLDEKWIDGSIPEVGRTLPYIWSSDGHSQDQMGRRFTWIKMTTPNFEGLRLAFLDGQESLIPSKATVQEDPNKHADLAIERMTVRQAKFIGRQSPVIVGFSPWLNTIIGARGTGKSSLVDFFRKVLCRDSELDGGDGAEDGPLRQLFDRRMGVPTSRQDDSLLTNNTVVEVVYRKDGERFVITWSAQTANSSIFLLDGDELIAQQGDVRERFPVRIYSQKQLFALAQDANALLTVIDDSVSVRRAEIDRSAEQLQSRYLAQCAEARAAANQANDLPARRAALEDVRRKLNVLQASGHTEVFQDYRVRRQQDDAWKTAISNASGAVQVLEHTAAEISVDELDFLSDTDDDRSLTALSQAHESLKRTIMELQEVVQDAVQKAQQDIRNIQTSAEVLTWNESVQSTETRYREVADQLSQEGILDPDEYDSLLDQAGKLSQEIAGLIEQSEQATALEKEAISTLAAYRAKHRELTERRETFAEATSSDLIRVDIQSNANWTNLTNELGSILGIERFEEDRQAIARRIQPKPNESWNWSPLDEVVSETRSYIRGESEAWDMRDQRFATALKRVPPERIDRLALYLPEDAVNVEFQDTRGGGWRPLAQGSPGQQTAALLAFVLGYGSEPIILDQPEDDLDNTLIYDLLVNRLREIKQKRQVIVVTHNPNIVVHGDAELVLSLEAANGRTSIACAGGLQEMRIRKVICTVMEGGSEAFEKRYQRIMPR